MADDASGPPPQAATRSAAGDASGFRAPRRPRNDPRQYDDLVEHWWRPGGAFAALHWLAAARAAIVPPASRPGAVLVDLACGGGLLAPHVDGYHHVGVDLNEAALSQARSAGIAPVAGDVTRLPLPDGVADVVVAGEIYEHVAELDAAVAETARITRPRGAVIIDTVADNPLSKLAVGYIQERLPGGPPPRIHDPSLFVSPRRLRAAFDRHGVTVITRGLRVHPLDYLRFLADRRRLVRMVPSHAARTVYQGIGFRRQAAEPTQRSRSR